jgi:hypothetical protein
MADMTDAEYIANELVCDRTFGTITIGSPDTDQGTGDVLKFTRKAYKQMIVNAVTAVQQLAAKAAAARIAELTRERDDARADRGQLLANLEQLADAAELFSADQGRATDPRCGRVQPVTVAECEALNAALAAARECQQLSPKENE